MLTLSMVGRTSPVPDLKDLVFIQETREGHFGDGSKDCAKAHGLLGQRGEGPPVSISLLLMFYCLHELTWLGPGGTKATPASRDEASQVCQSTVTYLCSQ